MNRCGSREGGLSGCNFYLQFDEAVNILSRSREGGLSGCNFYLQFDEAVNILRDSFEFLAIDSVKRISCDTHYC